MWEHLSSKKVIEGHHLQTTMSLELVAYDGRSKVVPLFASTNQIRTIRIMLGPTMVELSTTHEANSPTSLDVLLQQQQDPGPPLPSSKDATAATSSPQERTPSPQPQPQPQATKASATSAAVTMQDAPEENKEKVPADNEEKIHEASKTEHGKRRKWMREMRCLRTVMATATCAVKEEKKHKESKKKDDKHEDWEKEMRGWLMVVVTVFATMTYQAGLTPPGGFWSDDEPPPPLSCNATSITNVTTPSLINTTIVCITSSNMAPPSPDHEAGHAILEEKDHDRYEKFKIANTVAFVYSMAAIVLLLSNRLYGKLEDKIELKGVVVFNAFLIVFAYSAGFERHDSISPVPLATMSAIVFLYILDYVIQKIFKDGKEEQEEQS
ncbi:uncharacterized protein [Elaeis guineensis]|uniref:uncharacterized protein isoform X2 n=1 Tax=Elaeis guineensis var. tenera TaxID=51953 RepID=UPI003C6D6A32